MANETIERCCHHRLRAGRACGHCARQPETAAHRCSSRRGKADRARWPVDDRPTWKTIPALPIQGPELMHEFRKQAERFGTEFMERGSELILGTSVSALYRLGNDLDGL